MRVWPADPIMLLILSGVIFSLTYLVFPQANTTSILSQLHKTLGDALCDSPTEQDSAAMAALAESVSELESQLDSREQEIEKWRALDEQRVEAV